MSGLENRQRSIRLYSSDLARLEAEGNRSRLSGRA